MLVLSRKRMEEIVIPINGIEIVIALVSVRGDKARIGVTAPAGVPIHRREVYDAIKREGGDLNCKSGGGA